MKITCPHCAQRIAIGEEALASLAGASEFDCPTCGGRVPMPAAAGGSRPSSAMEGGVSGDDWRAPEAEDVARTFDQRYRIGRIIGRGGMGAVYEGFDTRLDRRVAVKILPPGSLDDVDALARFEREAKTMAALDHPHIVHIHDYGRTVDGHPFLVMEFIDGMDIHALRKSGRLDLSGALQIVSQVCSALHYAHSRGIVHRDIKPANILITREGVAKVGDFGLAKVLGTESRVSPHPTLTLSGSVMGTPDYMAPEQMEGSAVDHRADIYSLGVMLYDLLTGAPPRGAWPPPSQRVQVDVRLDEIVLRALQQNPSARYQAAVEVKGDIDHVATTTGGGPLPPGSDPGPLPSTTGGKIPAVVSAGPGQSTRSVAPRAGADTGELLETARSLNTTMLVLGLLGVGVIGGLSLFLANRKTGDTYHTEQTITNSVTHNTYFTRIINAGLATAEDLSAIGDIRPHGDALIGISKEPLSWEQARALAEKTGATVLPLDPPAGEELAAWLSEAFAPHLAAPAWIVAGGKPHLLDTAGPIPAEDLSLSRKAFLVWNLASEADTNEGPTTGSEMPSVENDFKYTSDGISITITGYTGSGGDIAIPAEIDGLPVRMIGENAFKENSALTGVIIPAGVTSIETAAFLGCKNLTKVSLPDSLAFIGYGAFTSCERLASVALPSGIASIEGWAFAGCKNFGSLSIPAGVVSIKDFAFYTSGLTTVTLPPAVTSIGENAFNSTRLASVTIPANVTSIGNGAFMHATRLSIAVFSGDAPSMGTDVFADTAPNFAIHYHKGAKGFTTPEWNGYKTKEIEPAADATRLLTWISKKGETLEGAFLRLEREAVMVRKADGKETKLPFSLLSPESIELAKKLAAEFP